MKFNIKSYIKSCFRELIVSGILFIGITITLVPPSMLTYFIINKGDTIFYIKHISNFFCIFGLYIAILNSLHFINRDFTMGTIELVCNSKENRLGYLNANILLASLLSVIYAFVGVVTVLVAKELGVPGELSFTFLIGFFFNIILSIIFYSLFCLLLFYLSINSNIVFSFLTLLLLFIPNIISNILYSMRNELFNNIFEKIPLYFMPIFAGSNIMGTIQYIISIFSIYFLYMLLRIRSQKLTF